VFIIHCKLKNIHHNRIMLHFEGPQPWLARRVVRVEVLEVSHLPPSAEINPAVDEIFVEVYYVL
jgi:hypothetical protein